MVIVIFFLIFPQNILVFLTHVATTVHAKVDSGG